MVEADQQIQEQAVMKMLVLAEVILDLLMDSLVIIQIAMLVAVELVVLVAEEVAAVLVLTMDLIVEVMEEAE